VTGGGSLPASTDEFLTPVRQLNGLVYDGHRDRLITYGGTSWRQTPADTLIDAYALSFEKPRRTIRVDLRPNAGSDKVNPSSHEAVQVAALSDANFDARQLDLATVYVAGVPVRHDGGGRPIFTVRDVDGDGREDIVVHFDAHDLPITEANVAVKLWGHTFDDVPVEGIAAVQVHVPGQGPVDQTGQADVHNAPAFEIALAPDGVAFQCRLANLPGARVELFDVNGRRLASAAGGTSATHSLTLTPPSRPAPGLYFARLTGPATLTRKVFVLR
jgi:hypothetical protein